MTPAEDVLAGGAVPQPAPPRATRPFLAVKDLKVQFRTDDGVVKAVDGLSFGLERGKRLGIVGESGSGKSVTSLSIMGLHKQGSADISGEIWVGGRELVSSSPEQVRRLRGSTMAMIFQDPLSAMHPYYSVGAQIVEAYRLHNDVTKADARKRAIDLLDRVGIPQARSRFDDYPHTFSGGMRQRAMIAMALSCNPDLLIADEPTTALDVTVQAQILDLIVDLQSEFDSAVVIITHDLGVVAELADDILVMYGGRAVEYGTALEVFTAPQHPYTWGLLGSMPRWDRERTDRLLPIKGSPPSLINIPPGCAFHPRCDFADRTGGRSQTERPELRDGGGAVSRLRGDEHVGGAVSRLRGDEHVGGGHLAACHLPVEERTRIFTDEIRPKL